MNGRKLARIMEREAEEAVFNGSTGYSRKRGEMWVRFYPACGRYHWLDDTGPVTKRIAIIKLNQWLGRGNRDDRRAEPNRQGRVGAGRRGHAQGKRGTPPADR
jgi:hypothetical protein